MGPKVQVCPECTQNCLLFHGEGKRSHPLPTSFFKIMHPEDDFRRILCVPPKFSPTLSPLVNKKIIIKDSSGQQWKVTVSNVGNSFAFEEGWTAFSLDHGLEVGDFLVFNYIYELHFDVKIYGKSGIERLDFSKKRNKKRSRVRSGSPVRDSVLVRQGPNASVVTKPDVPIMKRQHNEVNLGGSQNNTEDISEYDNNNGSAQPMCIAENREDPPYLTSLDYCAVDGTGKITTRDPKVSHVGYGAHASQNDANMYNKSPSVEGILGRGAALDASEFQFPGRNDSLKGTDKSAYNKASTMKPEENRENNLMKSNREVQCQLAEGLEGDQVVISNNKHTLHTDGYHKLKFSGIPNISDAIHNGEMSKKIKKEHGNKTPNGCSSNDKLCATGEMPKSMKIERVSKTPNGCSSKDKLCATSEMPKSMKKEHVSKTPNGCSSKDKLCATGEMPKIMKKEPVNKIPNGCSSIDKLCATGESTMITKEHVNKTPNGCSSKDKLCATGEMSKSIKIELAEMTPDMSNFKDELGATGLSKVNEDAPISCVVPSDNDSFLELPTCLPLSPRGKVKFHRRVVFLRDPLGRLWPVLYHEQLTFQILTAGWLQFRRANDIQPADVCKFGLENGPKRIFSVGIIHN